jgi:2-polyprenyl-6-methoxyphenol hydroxylase-like FAD-dependent oxidoreductase
MNQDVQVREGKEHDKLGVEPAPDPGPRVLIAGGSITGLSLALMLEQASIDFVVLEEGPVMAPQVGAGLAFFPGGARIADQLGLLPELLRISSIFDPMYDWRPDGTENVCVQGVSPFFEVTLGYPVVFLDRQEAVSMFFNAIRAKDKVVTGEFTGRESICFVELCGGFPEQVEGSPPC